MICGRGFKEILLLNATLKRSRTCMGLGALALLLAAQGSAQAASGQKPPAPAVEAPQQNKAAPPLPSTEVSGVTVTLSKEPPHVVSTFPAGGASVAPGVLVLRVTYSQPMFDESWSYVSTPDGAYPDCAPTPRLLDDKKSFALICRVSPKTSYALWLNHGAYANFVNRGRRKADAYELKFVTSNADSIRTLNDAMNEDKGLPPGSNPAEPAGKARPGEPVPDFGGD
jgi:hypothetical protein